MVDPDPNQAGWAQQHPVSPYDPGQQGGHPQDGLGGFPAGQPAKKKKAGLVFGLVGGAVVAVVAVLGLVVFDWSGGPSGPVLTREQVETLLSSDFVKDLTDGAGISAAIHTTGKVYDDADVPDGCQAEAALSKDRRTWSTYLPTPVAVTQFSTRISVDTILNASIDCARGQAEPSEREAVDRRIKRDRDGISITRQDGGSWATTQGKSSVVFVYGNIHLEFTPAARGDVALKELFTDFQAAVDAAAR